MVPGVTIGIPSGLWLKGFLSIEHFSTVAVVQWYYKGRIRVVQGDCKGTSVRVLYV